MLMGVLLEDGQALLKGNPKIHSYQTISFPYQVAMRTDKQNLPYKDLRVRQALMMATDMQGMKDGLYKGQAEILDSPARKFYTGVYTPIDQLPEGTKELYAYNPEKAKQLLKDAGFPTGFPAKMAVTSASSDLAAVLKDQWAKVGITLTLDVKDALLFSSMFATRNYEELYFSTFPGGSGALFTRYGNNYFRGPNNFNLSYANDPPGSDPTIEGYFQDVQKYVQVNYPKAEEIMKNLNLYTLSKAFLIPTPAPYVYTMWQPWINNYYGEGSVKYWLEYLWIDQNLKTSSGH
jgi:peptide/nickel transport system substrate-binding protein